MQLTFQVAHFGVVADSFGCLDFTLVLLDVFVDGFHGNALRPQTTLRPPNRRGSAQFVYDKSLTSLDLGFGIRRYSASGLEFAQFQPSLF